MTEPSHFPELSNAIVRLIPAHEDHAAAINAVTPRDTFRYFLSWPSGAPNAWTDADFAEWWKKHISTSNTRVYTVIDRATDTIVGSTAFLDIDPKNRAVEVGATWYSSASRGTAINPACKHLMLAHALETLGCVRVTLKCDGRNLHSQRAIAKLGATPEGTLFSHRIQPNGFVRDTVYFSIVPSRWPRIAAKLLARFEPATQIAAGKCEVRAATTSDVPAILPLVQAVCDYHRTLDPQRFGFLPDVAARYASWLPQRVADADSTVLVAFESDSPGTPLVGFLVGEVLDSIPVYDVARFGFIHDLFVLPTHRGRGLGRALVERAANDFRRMGMTQVRGETASANDNARALLRSMGWRESVREVLLTLESSES